MDLSWDMGFTSAEHAGKLEITNLNSQKSTHANGWVSINLYSPSNLDRHKDVMCMWSDIYISKCHALMGLILIYLTLNVSTNRKQLRELKSFGESNLSDSQLMTTRTQAVP